MSDFVHSFWSHYIAWITLAGILACVVLLWLTSRKKLAGSADNTTGHVWDEDLREMNNPLPLWWVGLFVITIVFALFYLTLYPGLGSSEGSLAWTSQNQYQQEVDQANADVAPLYARFDAMAPEQVALDPQARHIGEHLFLNNCAQCHGSDARGTKGFPNLTDAVWLYGGSPEQIRTSITHGRQGNMPPMAAAVGSPEDVKNLAHHVPVRLATRLIAGCLGQRQVWRLRGLPRRRWQRQSGLGRPQFDRQNLAAWLGRRGHCGHGRPGQTQPDAWARGAAHTLANPCVERLCVGLVPTRHPETLTPG